MQKTVSRSTVVSTALTLLITLITIFALSAIISSILPSLAYADGEPDINTVSEWSDWSYDYDEPDCEIGIDSSGCLWLRPKNGASVGHAGDYSMPYSDFNAVKVKPNCSIYFIDSGFLSSLIGESSLRKFYGQGMHFDDTNWTSEFAGKSDIEYLDLENWDVSSVTDMSSMFEGMTNLTYLNVKGWSTTNVTTMGSMFSGCQSMTSFADTGIADWDVSNVTDMGGMFCWCKALKSIDLHTWRTDSLENISWMFDGDTSSMYELKSVNLSGWNTTNITSAQAMFNYCDALETINISGWSTFGTGADLSALFASCTSLTEIVGLDDINITNAANISQMFTWCSSLPPETADIVANWTPINATNMHSMFANCQSFTHLDLSKWDTSNVTNVASLCEGCSALTTLNLGGKFNTINVTDYNNMTSMLSSCDRLQSLTLGEYFKLAAYYPYGIRIPDPADSDLWDATLYTGKWINSSVSDASPVSHSDLDGYYDRTATSGSYARGTYVWDRTPKGKLKYSAESVEYVNTSTDGSDIPSAEYWTTTEEKTLVDDAVLRASGLLESGDSSTDWDTENIILTNAINRYNASKHKGLLVSVDVVHTLYGSAVTPLSGITYTVTLAKKAPTAAQLNEGFEYVPDGVTPNTLTFSPATTAEWTGNEWTKTSTKQLQAVPIFGAASNFQNAGIYLFDVTETVSGISGEQVSSWADNGQATQSYMLQVVVVNDGNGLAYDQLLVSAGTKLSQMDFSTRYEGTNTLTVSKAAVGKWANQSHQFPITVTLYLPAWTSGTVAENVSASTNATTNSEGFAEESDGSKSVTYSTALAHGQLATFTVPCGTRYSINETGLSFEGVTYVPSFSWTVDGGAANTYDESATLSASTGELTTQTIVGAAAGNAVAITNTAPDDIIQATGMFLGNYGYLILISGTLIAAFAWITMRRRRRAYL